MKSTITILICIISFQLYAQALTQKTEAVPGKSLPYTIHQTKTPQSGKNYVPGLIIIKLNPEWRTALSGNRLNDASLQSICSEMGLLSFRPLFPQHHAREDAKVDLSLLYELRFDNAASIPTLCARLMTTGQLEYAEPRFNSKPIGNIKENLVSNCLEESVSELLSFIPNDSLYGQQMMFLSKIYAPEAWDVEQGDTSVVIAIVDSGTDYLHPDLVGNVAYNYADPINGLDDDINGYVDDYQGWDLSDNDNNPDIPISNFNIHHGTSVAGVAAASTNNALGVASPGFNCKFFPVKIASDLSAGELSYDYEGVVYAADRGAKVINCSWGDYAVSRFAADIIKYAVTDKDALVVCGGGNEGAEVEIYPASYEYAVGVAATDLDDKKTGYSSFNHLIDISSPAASLVIRPGGTYFDGVAGTSFSSPTVAGAAALVRSHFPNLNALQTAERLRITTDPVDNLNPNYVEKIGKGRLNIYRALTESNVKAVRFREVQITDNNDEVFRTGDTVRVWGDFVNYLNPTTNLVCKMTSTIPGIIFLNNTFSAGLMATMEGKSNVTSPFSFIIQADVGMDKLLLLRIGYSDGNYEDWQWLNNYVRANKSYIDIQNDQISTTSNSAGRFGFMQDGNQEGLGFHYLPADFIEFRMTALMIGNSTTRVSDVSYNVYPFFEKDFKITEPIHLLSGSTLADQVFTCTFNDSLNTVQSRLGLDIHQNIYLWDNDKFLISEYHITNKSNNTYNTLYVGLNDEMNIGLDTYSKNRNNQDSTFRLGYQLSTIGTNVVSGTQLLTPAPFIHYAYEWNNTYGGVDISNGFNNAEKFSTLSSNHSQAGYNDSDGEDCGQIVSSGPFVLAPGQMITVAFALLAGSDLQDLQNSAVLAKERYDEFAISSTQTENVIPRLKVYPNPTNDVVYFSFGTYDGLSSGFVQVYDFNGRRILVKAIAGNNGFVDLSNLPSGLYLLKIECGDKSGMAHIVKQ